MPENTLQQNQMNIATRILSIEERQSLIKERILVLTQSFIKRERELQKNFSELENSFRELKAELRQIKTSIERNSRNIQSTVKKEELRSLEKYIKLWQPIKFITQEEFEKNLNELRKSIQKLERKHS